MPYRLLLAAAYLWTVPVRADHPVTIPAAIQTSLETHCFACHADGASEGGLSFERLAAGQYGQDNRAKWISVWKNVRAEMMPPPDDNQLGMVERQQLITWIEDSVFRLDPNNPDPGVVTARRLNREEFRNAIEDLLGVDYDVTDLFPPDDTGYGFDTIGDALNMSPVLFEKYLAAAEHVTTKAVPLNGPSLPRADFWTDRWKGDASPDGLPFDTACRVRAKAKVPRDGAYRVRVNFEIDQAWTELPETAHVQIELTDSEGRTQPLGSLEAGWETRKKLFIKSDVALPKGGIAFQLNFTPGHPHQPSPDPAIGDSVRYTLRIADTVLTGPVDAEPIYNWPASHIFFDGPPPTEETERVAYTREILRRKATLAFRRPVDDETLGRLVNVAVTEMNRPGRRFEHGIQSALALVVASPRFLFRLETQPRPNDPTEVVLLDEFDLASRMAFFLWSSIPDYDLQSKARAGELRADLDNVIDEMLSESWRRETFVRNFVGQWLQLRDIHNVDSNERRIVGGKDKKAWESLSRYRWHIREAMRVETERLFEHLIVDSRPIEELLTARYTFANKHLAKLYGLPAVDSARPQKVNLPLSSHRRGILTHGSFLLVTSNPTRTSPVKRGLFVLENFLGTPAPPAPADVPELSEVKTVDLETSSLRIILEAHREKAECATCHQRMDPLGLAMEHFDALGRYRDVEPAQFDRKGNRRRPERPIDVSGRLLTGESFETLDELIDILATTRRRDLYRCLAEKMLTYAIGRGIEYTDAPAVDKIVAAVEADNGSLRTLIKEIVKSTPFQYRRGYGDRSAVPAP